MIGRDAGDARAGAEAPRAASGAVPFALFCRYPRRFSSSTAAAARQRCWRANPQRGSTRSRKHMTRALKPLGPVALTLVLGLAGCGEQDTTTPASRAHDATTEEREIAGNGIDR